MSAISIGDKLDGKYVVTRKLGSGGFGHVYLATDEAIPDRQVAIKVLTRPSEGDQSDLLWEMRTLAQFNHPNIVAFYHYFADANQLYLVMEFCPGGSLDDLLVAEMKHTVEKVFGWGITLCHTLYFVHGKGIVHHDIKPQNILFANDCTIKLGDFGMANRRGGTRMYMPPEMLLGERVGRLDPRVDVYSLGLTLLESITGKHPFEDLAPDVALQARIQHGFISADLPRWVQEILLKATHPTPELRFQSAADFAEAIRSRHVPYVFDLKRIRAGDFAVRAESALRLRRWRVAEKYASHAVELCPTSVAALLAAGRCQMMIRRIDRASKYFSRALLISPRTSIQKELGWINLEQGNIATAISILTDHLQRYASDYEAYNMLLKCFYLSERYEAGEALARMLIEARANNECFEANQLLCRILKGDCTSDELETLRDGDEVNPFMRFNATVAVEDPKSWDESGKIPLSSKLLFEEFRFGDRLHTGGFNTIAVYASPEKRYEFWRTIVSIGSLKTNDLIINDDSASRRHCVIVNFPNDVWIYDLGSTVGTMIDGERISGRAFLSGVHDVTIGRVHVRIAAKKNMLL